MSFDVNNEVYQKLLECKWFENCGTEVNVEYSFPVKLIDDIKSVIDGINKTSWINFCLERREATGMKIRRENRDEFEKWNIYIQLIKEQLLPSIVDRIKIICEEKKLPEKILTKVRNEIMIVLLFEIYKPVAQCEIYLDILNIYLSGHIPCDVAGSKKNGKIVVY